MPAKPASQFDASGVVPYDLTTHERIVRGKMPTLELINEKFARQFRITMQTILRSRIINVMSQGTSIIKFQEYLQSLPVPSSIHIIKMDPLRGSCLMVIESKLVFTIIDIMFGGTGKEPYKVEGREFSSLENNIIQRIIRKALADFESAWTFIVPLVATFQKTEINPQFCMITLPTDPVAVMTFMIETEFASGKMTVCVPYSVLEPIRDKLTSRFPGDQKESEMGWLSKFQMGLMFAGVDVSVEIGRVNLTGAEVLNLKKGDVILMDRHCFDPLEVMMGGKRKFKGIPGIHKGNYAVQITGIEAAEEETNHEG